MIDEKQKAKYIELIDSLGLNDPVTANLKAFVSSYNGTNEKDFHTMMLSLIAMLSQLDELLIKAEGYDNILESDDYTSSQIKLVTKEFEDLKAGKAPAEPMVSKD